MPVLIPILWRYCQNNPDSQSDTYIVYIHFYYYVDVSYIYAYDLILLIIPTELYVYMLDTTV